jgi:hypothetical protein
MEEERSRHGGSQRRDADPSLTACTTKAIDRERRIDEHRSRQTWTVAVKDDDGTEDVPDDVQRQDRFQCQ